LHGRHVALPSLHGRPVMTDLADNATDISSMNISPAKRTTELPALENHPALPKVDDQQEAELGSIPSQRNPQSARTLMASPENPPLKSFTQIEPRGDKPKVTMDSYLENFDNFDLDELLKGFSRPGSRLSRPGSRLSGGGMRQSPDMGMCQSPDMGLNPDADNKGVSAWPEYQWPSSRKSATSVPGTQSTMTPRTPHTATSTSSARTFTAGQSTSESWRSVMSPEGRSMLDHPPSTAPGTRRSEDGRSLPGVPEYVKDTGRSQTASASARPHHVGYPASGRVGVSGHAAGGLANMCRTLEHQAAAAQGGPAMPVAQGLSQKNAKLASGARMSKKMPALSRGSQGMGVGRSPRNLL